MTSVLRTLQEEWNALVPTAQARGIRRVRILNTSGLLETIEYRRAKLEWLRSQIGTVGGFDSLTFGVEFECILPDGLSHSALAAKITEAGVPCEAQMYNHSRRTMWKVVTDGSLGDYRKGAEVVSPVLRGEDGFAQLRKVCDALVAARARVSKKCGFHVHVGASDWQLYVFKNLIKLYASAEKAIDTFMAPSRRESNCTFASSLIWRIDYTALEGATTVGRVARAIRQDDTPAQVRSHKRYCKINLQSFWQHGTVEFRQHQGTVEAIKAENWVRLVLRMVLTAKAGEKTVSSMDDLLLAVDATDVEKNYFNGRVIYFNQQQARRAS